MSNSYYSKLWLETRQDFEKILHLDKQIQGLKPIKQPEQCLQRLIPMYLMYRELLKRLITCYDQIIQSQKRQLIKQILDGCIGRMLEYKQEIAKLIFSDYLWSDNYLIANKWTPDDLNISTPRSYIEDRREILDRRKQDIDDLCTKGGIEQPTEMAGDILSHPTITPNIITPLRENNESRTLIAPEEKVIEGKQDIGTEKPDDEKESGEINIAEESNDQQKATPGTPGKKNVRKSVKLAATLKIQRAWRELVAYRKRQRRLAEMEELMSMTISSNTREKALKKDAENFRRRMEQQPQTLQKVEDKKAEERNRLGQTMAPRLAEDIAEEIREWFMYWYNELGFFDVYPPEEIGGSILVVTGQTLTPEEYLIDQFEKSKKKGREKKTKKTKETKEAKAKAKELGWRMPKSKALAILEEADEEFKNWSLRDDVYDPRDQIYIDPIQEQLCHGIQIETRKNVDEQMRLELGKLNEALTKDHASYKEKFSMPKSPKGKKPRRKKEKNDPLEGVSAEDILSKLVRDKVIRKYQKVRLDDWLGDLSYQNYEAGLEFRDYQHRLGEIKHVIMEYCILPLGSKEAHQMAPLSRSVCICGLPRYGKKFLVNAICSELEALLIDLTPNILAGQFLEKKELTELFDMVSKISREYSPTIVYIEGGEKPWWKKVPPEEQHTQPKRLAPFFKKIIKAIKPGDQVLFLATSAAPYSAGAAFKKIYDKFIIIPDTDYNSMYLYCTNLLMKYPEVDRHFDVSTVARFSAGLPLELVRDVILKVLTSRRRARMKNDSLQVEEIVDELWKLSDPDQKAIEQYLKFQRLTPLGKKRAKLLAAEKETAAEKKGDKETN